MAFGEEDFASLTRPHRGPINAARVLLILKAVLSTAMAYSVGALVDAAIAQSMPGAALWLGVLTGLTALKAVQNLVLARTTGKLRVAVRRDFRIALFGRVLRLKPESLGGEKPHDLAARLARDTGGVTVKNVTIPVHFPHLVIQFGLGVGFLVATSWQLAGLVLASIPLLGYLSWRFGRRISALQEEAATRQAAMTRAAGELLQEAGGMKGEADRGRAEERYAKVVRENEDTFLDIIRVSANFNSIQEFLMFLGSEVLVLGVGLAGFLLYGYPSVGQVMALRGYAKDLRGAVDGLIGLYTDGKDAEGSTKRVRELWKAEG
jgi:ABC-type multidrug transport system fused ATPase/permease subunit